MKLGRQWDERLKIWDEAFAAGLYTPLGEAPLSGFTTREQLTLAQAGEREFRPFPEGISWGEKWEYGWFRTEVTLPAEAAGKRIMLHIGAGPEMLVFVNGRESGSIDKQHAFVELTDRAVPGGHFEIYAEVYAGHGVRAESGGIFSRDAIPVPEPPKRQCVVGRSHFGILDEELFRIYADYHTLYELWKAMPDSDLRTMKIGEALQQFTLTADFEAEEPRRRISIRKAGELLRPLLEKHNSDTVPAYTVFGQSHIDLAWLWTREETKRKSARTYSNQIKLMERYPDYKFLLCSPTVLEDLKEYYPNLYARVKELAGEGRFLPEGGLYVESDTNLAGGESLIRQFVLGKRWFREEFGADSRVAWLPDTFGFTGALPQIMAGCRVPYFATQKLLRSDPESEPFPYNIFWWEGIDGTRVLSHIFKKNNTVFNAGELRRRWEEDRNQKQEIDSFLYPFGYGDGGGGPTEIMVETAARCRDLEGAPRCTMESPAAFFDRLAAGKIRNVYYGELYLAWHRGTYTAQAAIKRGVRRTEYALREAEYLAGLMRLTGSYRDASEEEQVLKKLEGLWKTLLIQEFHDILPGSSIQRVNEEARQALEETERESRLLAKQLLAELADSDLQKIDSGIGKAASHSRSVIFNSRGVVFNSLSWERSRRGLRLPACGYVILKAGADINGVPEEAERDGVMPGVGAGMQAAETIVFENAYYRAEVDGKGRIISLTHRGSGYEYAEKPLNDWKLYRDVNVAYDAWELGRMYEEAEEDLIGGRVSGAEREPDGSLIVTVEYREPYFTARQRILLAMDSPRIDFETEIDWRERHRILKVDFPTTVYTKEVLEEIQFGYIRRPTHKSRRYEQDLYETCHHKYAALTDGENGFAVLNDCKYGLSAEDSRLSLTLLRAPVLPDMTADMGVHHFTYSILPFSGPFTASRVTEEAYELNVEATEAGTQAETEREFFQGVRQRFGADGAEKAVSFFRLEGGHVVLETCKPAFDREKGVVLRLYESKGCAGVTTLTLNGLLQVKHVYACNMLEEPERELELRDGRLELNFRAFEIKTILISH
ncbi:MAG: glycosyl hydrolase-related protein [Butyrivibrio sp.]|nr:glycosyl hydrolase-related protein [Acetatifactor muris]MCM1559110.1 glycosyl hydrolase-related protein [Butyrivibrio sp.]